MENLVSLDKWLEKIESLTASDSKIMLGLERVEFYSKKLNLGKPAKQVITVAGTNGKGTTVKLLETLYSKAGYNTASFISPHLMKFNERVSINNNFISDDKLIQAFNAVSKVFLEYQREYKISYFEFVFLSAWYIYYNFYNLDLLILEVGLGGRLDAVNIIDNDFSIITSVALDHQKFLGNTLDEIAYEKAGIIKINSTVIFGDNIPDTAFKQAQKCKAKIKVLNKDFSIILSSKNKLETKLDTKLEKYIYKDKFNNKFNINIEFNSGIVLDNIAICLKLVLVNNRNKNLILSEEYLNKFFSNFNENFKMPARAEFLKLEKFNLLFDIAHNEHAIYNLFKKISNLKNKYKFNKVYAICGMLQDKNAKKCLTHMTSVIDSWGLIDLSLTNSRGHNSLSLQNFIPDSNTYQFDKAIEAFNYFKEELTTDDLLVVFGSFYTVSQLYDKCI
tara:strand:+ start:7393 stop:8733 length:1341 start_codon:yes stop_codon:yes gene_type:complete